MSDDSGAISDDVLSVPREDMDDVIDEVVNLPAVLNNANTARTWLEYVKRFSHIKLRPGTPLWSYDLFDFDFLLTRRTCSKHRICGRQGCALRLCWLEIWIWYNLIKGVSDEVAATGPDGSCNE